MLPEPIACLRCRFPRTMRVGDRRVCFQCRYSWGPHAGVAVAVAVEAVQPSYVFTPIELARLKAYRRAVQAGFYTDALRSPYRRISQVSATRSWE